MKIGIQTGAFTYIADVKARYAHIKSLGYDTVDVSLADTKATWYQDTAVMEAHCREIHEAAAAAGIEISQVHGPWPTDDTSEEKRALVLEDMRRSMYGCYLMGAHNLVIHPQMPFGHGGVNEDPEFALEKTVELMRNLLPDCEKYDVVLCLENMPFTKQRISTIDRIVEAVEKVGSPYAGVCFDTGHGNVFGRDLGDDVRCCARYLRVLHVHDNNGRMDSHLLPYRGTANWESFTKALAEVGYTGSLSLETVGPTSGHMPQPLLEQGQKLTVNVARWLADQVEAAK
ncbi:MAG: sugar phosphate isomerase/epimerase [Clostridia bacterium]|nr:sugar phosphate isomerase/epimerase [Clostridia bacterium]